MAKLNSIQSSFTLGEVSPRVRGQTDNQQYSQMVKELTNGNVIPQGGVQRRAGTQLKTYTPTNLVYLATPTATCDDFVTKVDNYFREYAFITSDGKRWILIMRDDEITTWNFFDVTAAKLYPFADRDGIVETCNEAGALADITAGAMIDCTGIDLEEIQIEKSGDVLFIVHSSFPPITVRYRTFTADVGIGGIALPIGSRWDMSFKPNGSNYDDSFDEQKEFTQSQPYLEKNILNSNGNGYITYTGMPTALSTITLTSELGIFSSAWIGTFIRFTDLNTSLTGLVVVGIYTSPTSVDAFVLFDLPSTVNFGGSAVPDTYWEESAWSLKNGYPRAVTAYGGRILYGGNTVRPNRVWASAVGDVDELCEIPYAQDPDFATYTSDTSRAYSFDIVGCEQIRWMNSGKRIFIGASNKEFVAFSDTGLLTADNTKVESAGGYGSAARSALRVGNEILFVQKSKQRLRSLVFSFQEDDYKSQDITRLAEHIARVSRPNIPKENVRVPSFGTISVATSPDTRLWSTDNNAGLISCAFDREASVIAWGTHYLGGINGDVLPEVMSQCVLPSYDNSNDDVYLLVKRTMNSADMVTMEKIGPYFNEIDYTNSAFSPLVSYTDWLDTRAVFLDCAVGDVQGAATDTWTFATHKNETVDVLANGAYLGQYTLDNSGVLVLPDEYEEVIIGYNYDTIIETMNFETIGTPQSNQGKIKTATEVWCRFNRTSNAKVQRSGQSDWQTLEFVDVSNPSTSPVDLFTGDKRAHVGNVERDMSIIVKQDKPLPFELLAIIFQGMIYD